MSQPLSNIVPDIDMFGMSVRLRNLSNWNFRFHFLQTGLAIQGQCLSKYHRFQHAVSQGLSARHP